jgi:hypothetical protein
MNADMLNRGTEDPPLSLSLSLSLSLYFIFFRGGGGERPLLPPLDPPLEYLSIIICNISYLWIYERFQKFYINDNIDPT